MSAPPRVYLAPISFGLGDLVVSLPAFHGLIAAGAQTWLVARSPAQERLAGRIDGLAGVVREESLELEDRGATLFNLRDHPLQTDFFWGSAEFERAYGKLGINEILERICADLGVPARFDKPVPLRADRRADARDAVLFVAGSDGPAKHWPTQGWIALAESIRARGLDVRVVTGGGSQAEQELCAMGIGAADAPALGDAVDWLSSCRAVVGVDTGLTHIAVQQGTPTVAIQRRHSLFFRAWPHTRVVIGEDCDPECLRRAEDVAYCDRIEQPAAAWRPWECAVGGRCLLEVRPDAVFAALCEVLGT